MRYPSDMRRRPSTRLEGYDYANGGAYFVTICTRGRECLLDDPVLRGIITDVWHALPLRFAHLGLDEFVVMPNHVHLVVWLASQSTGAGHASAPDGHPSPAVPPQAIASTPAGDVERAWVIPAPNVVDRTAKLGGVIGAFKSLATTVYLDWLKVHAPLRQAVFWQRNYYDHIIRDEWELHAIRKYIRDNPIQWELDRDNPTNVRGGRPANSAADYVADAANP